MTYFCRSRGGLRQFILQYFGEQAPGYCGNCYNCLHNFEETDVSAQARAIRACVEETGQRYGMGVLAAVLCGADEERLRRGGLERTASYGALRGRERREVLECIRFLIDRGILELTGGEYPVVRLGAENGGLPVGPLMMKTIREEERERPAATSKPAYTKLDAAQTELFGRLRTLRAELARRQGVPAFVVFSDKTLREMAALRPRSEREFRAVSGVGDRKAEQYGRAFLEEIAR